MVCLQLGASFLSVAHVLHNGICITLKKTGSMKASEESEAAGYCLPQHFAFSFIPNNLLERWVLESPLVLMQQAIFGGIVFQANTRISH